MNPPELLARLAAAVALEIMRSERSIARKRAIRDFGFRLETLMVIDESVLEQIAEGKVPESPPSPMPRGSEMLIERGR